MIIDCRLEVVAERCPTSDEPGVRLAHIWLYDPEGSSCCSVIGIDNEPPVRREFREDERPVPFGTVNLASVYWLPAREAKDKLKADGFETVNLRNLVIPTTLETLIQELTVSLSDLYVARPTKEWDKMDREPVQNQIPVLFVDPGSGRIVGFGDETDASNAGSAA